MTIADTLREARRRIEEPEKWGKGSARHLLGQKCAGDALQTIALSNSEEYIAARQYFQMAIGAHNWISVWNDAPERTHADVMAAFDRAIALAESAEEKT